MVSVNFPFVQISDSHDDCRGLVKEVGVSRVYGSSYFATAGLTPTQVLVENSNDRPDVASVAVLGYN